MQEPQHVLPIEAIVCELRSCDYDSAIVDRMCCLPHGEAEDQGPTVERVSFDFNDLDSLRGMALKMMRSTPAMVFRACSTILLLSDARRHYIWLECFLYRSDKLWSLPKLTRILQLFHRFCGDAYEVSHQQAAPSNQASC
eukprot:1996046-Amphidinium_carterae.1